MKAHCAQCPDDMIQQRNDMDILLDKVNINSRVPFWSCVLVSKQLHLISNPNESGNISNQGELQE